MPAYPQRGRRTPEWLFRFRRSLRRLPEVSHNIVWPLLIGLVLLIASVVTLQLRTDYLVEHTHAPEAQVASSLTFAPVWEESLKVGFGLLGGAFWAAVVVVGTWIREKRTGIPRPATRLLFRRAWLWSSMLLFLIMGVRAAVSEGLGGLNALKLVGHPGLSLLAVPVALEAKPRVVWFVGLGFGLHSMMNVVVNVGPAGQFRIALYLSALLFVLLIDGWFLSTWYPQVRSLLRRFSPWTVRRA